MLIFIDTKKTRYKKKARDTSNIIYNHILYVENLFDKWN